MNNHELRQQRAAALTNFPTTLERGDDLHSKLIAVSGQSLPSKQRVVDSNPCRDAFSFVL